MLGQDYGFGSLKFYLWGRKDEAFFVELKDGYRVCREPWPRGKWVGRRLVKKDCGSGPCFRCVVFLVLRLDSKVR